MSGADDETRITPPPKPEAEAPTILQPSGASDAETIALDRSHGSSSVSRPMSAGLAAARAASAPAVGVRRIGDYDLESEIARGGMGIVYKARQLSLNRPVAFKMILAGQFASAADVERFHVEAEAAAGLDHPNIVPIYEVGAFEGNHFFSMKFIDGHSMAREMPRLVKDPRAGVQLLVKVCRAIHYAHQHGILHRDLKPANILLDSSGEPHVTDFGLAKRTESDSGLTQTGTIVGTPSYMSPEQAAPSKTPLTTSADVYSLGAMLYEILTGRPPFKGDSPLDTLMLVIHKEPERPRAINLSSDRDLETVALKCLEKDPARRYGSAEALAEDLGRWLNQEPIQARPIGAAERVVKWAKRRPAIAALAAAIGVTTVLGLAGVIWQWREAVYQRGQTASALIMVAEEAQNAELARDKESAARVIAESAQAQEALQRQAADDQRAIAERALGASERSLYFNDVALADHEWAANNIGHVDQLLATSPAALRNWEWHYLNRLAHMEVATITAARDRVIALAVSPDGSTATTIGADLSASVWDLRTRRLVRTVKLDGTPGMEFGVTTISADGRLFAASVTRIAASALSEDAHVWDTATGKALWKVEGQGLFTVGLFALSPDGRRLITASTEAVASAPAPAPAGSAEASADLLTRVLGQSASRLRMWDARTGAELAPLGVLPGRAMSLVFSPDGSRVAVGAGVLSTPLVQTAPADPIDVKILDATSGKVLATLNQSGAATPVFSPDGRWIGANVPTGVRVWPAGGGDARWSWAGKATAALAFSAGGRFVAVALADRSIQILDATTGKDLSRLTGSAAPVSALMFAGANAVVVSIDADRLRIFAAQEPAPVRMAEGIGEQMLAIGVTPDQRRLVGATRAGALRGWDLETGRILFGSEPASSAAAPGLLALIAQAGPLAGRMFFSGDGQRTALTRSTAVDVGGGRQQMLFGLRVYDVATGRELAQFSPAPPHAEPPKAGPAPTAGAGTAPSTISSSSVTATGLDATGTHAAVAMMKVGVVMAALGSPTTSPMGAPPKMMINGSQVDVWSAPAERPTTTINLSSALAVALQFSPDGRRLVVLAGGYGDASPIAAEYRLYDVATGRLIVAFPGDKQNAPIAFSRDGNLLAAETVRHTVTIWDLAHPGHPVVLPEHGSAVTRLAFSPDGTRLASLSGQGVTLFDVRSGNQLLALRESSGPFTLREVIAPGRITNGSTTLAFTPDGRQIVSAVVSSDPRGIKVLIKTWDGSAREP